MAVVRTSLREELNASGSVLVPFHGESMLPLLRQDKDCAVIIKADFDDLKPMDIVLYYDPEREIFILHRLLWKEDHTAMMLGDNCTAIEKVSEDQICGRLSEFFRDGKEVKAADACYQLYVFLWAKPWKVRIALLKCLGKVKRAVLRGNRK